MRLKSMVMGIGLTLAVALAPARADLLESNVTGTLYYSDLSTVFSGPIGPVPVNAGIEFPVNSLAFDGQLDVTGSQITWAATSTAQYGAGTFNGFQLVFSGAPTITNVTVDASSTLPAVSFSFTGNEVLLNLAGELALAGEKTILDVQTSTSTSVVPEPATGLMTGMGILAIAILKRGRFGRT